MVPAATDLVKRLDLTEFTIIPTLLTRPGGEMATSLAAEAGAVRDNLLVRRESSGIRQSLFPHEPEAAAGDRVHLQYPRSYSVSLPGRSSSYRRVEGRSAHPPVRLRSCHGNIAVPTASNAAHHQLGIHVAIAAPPIDGSVHPAADSHRIPALAVVQLCERGHAPQIVREE